MGAMEDFNNPNLFTENPPGSYTYTSDALGKTARGQLQTADAPARDAQAQREAGGENRRGKGNAYGVDDGGHLIGARFGGSPGEENLTPQDRNLNRGGYKAMENDWADKLDKGTKVFVNIESYTGDGSARPTNYMGYVITETTDENGKTTRDIEYFSFNNESRSEQAKWEEEYDELLRDNPEFTKDMEQMAEEANQPQENEQPANETEAQQATAEDYGADGEMQQADTEDYGSDGEEQEAGTADYGIDSEGPGVDAGDQGAGQEAAAADYGAEGGGMEDNGGGQEGAATDYGADGPGVEADNGDYGVEGAGQESNPGGYDTDGADPSVDGGGQDRDDQSMD